MVAISLVGGLGNQLCIYAYGLYLKQRYNYDVVLDSSWFDKYGFDCDNKEKRELSLNKFNIQLPILSLSNIDKIKIMPFSGMLKYVVNAIAYRTFYRGLHLLHNRYMPIEDLRFVYDEKMLHVSDRSYISGHFASYRYFMDIDMSLSLVHDLDDKNTNMLHLIQSKKNSVAIHIRRGDYMNLHGFAKLGKTYYDSAIDIISNRLGDCYYFIFSNDIEFIKNNFIKSLNRKIQYTIVDINDNNPAFELYLMSSCNHQIIANSTFSFWAALMNPNINKIVVSPDRFAYDRNKDEFPREWIIVDHLWGGGRWVLHTIKRLKRLFMRFYNPSSSATLLP